VSKVSRFQTFFISIFVLIFFPGTALCQETFKIVRADDKFVPIVVYFPADACKGIVIISHGAGASEIVYPYLGKAMAAQGYLTVVPGHQESGLQGFNKKAIASKDPRKGLIALITDPEAYKGRFMDIDAAKSWAKERCDAKESILIGHSMGAATTMIEAGAKNKVGVSGSNSFDIYIALSPQGPGTIFTEKAWHEIAKPVLLLTGTRDKELDAPNWQNRTEPFDDMSPGCKWLGVIQDASHLNFAGIGLSGQTEKLTVKTIQAFLAGVHQHDCKMPEKEDGIEIKVK
jgi:predicted dienelactone hydrolase